MKISAVINRPAFPVDNTKKSAVISSAVLILGVVAGTLIYILTKNNTSDILSEHFISFSSEFINKDKSEIFSGLVFQNIVFFIVMLVLATCALGTPAVFILSYIKTMGLGMLVTYLYDRFALKGLEYCLLIILPGKLILIFSMLLLTQSCYLMSIDIYTQIKNNNSRVVDFKKFSLRALLILVFILLSGALDFITVTSFSALFNFC